MITLTYAEAASLRSILTTAKIYFATEAADSAEAGAKTTAEFYAEDAARCAELADLLDVKSGLKSEQAEG